MDTTHLRDTTPDHIKEGIKKYGVLLVLLHVSSSGNTRIYKAVSVNKYPHSQGGEMPHDITYHFTKSKLSDKYRSSVLKFTGCQYNVATDVAEWLGLPQSMVKQC